MITKEVEFTEEEKARLVNQICGLAENESNCHENGGHEFMVTFNDNLRVFATVLLNDDFVRRKPSRYASTDIQLIETEGFNKVKSNLDYLFEDTINKALIVQFRKRVNEMNYHI